MRLTVLGKSPAWQDAGGACSGYLVQEDGVTLLLDCGNGVYGALRETVAYVDVDAVVISHLHADHMLDLVPFAYALIYAARQQRVPVGPWPGTDDPARPVLHVPPGARAAFRRIVGTWGDERLIEKAFDLREYEPGGVLAIGPLRVRFTAVPHYVPTWAVEIRGADGARLTYGADHGPSPALVDFARDTDLLIVEATLPSPEDEEPRGHLTPAEAGRHGRDAGARRLLVTHFTDEYEEDWVRREAGEAFGGPVELARSGAVLDVVAERPLDA